MLVARPIGGEVVYVADRAPTVTDDFSALGARVGNRWVNQSTGEWWKCRSEVPFQAVWDRDTLGVQGFARNAERGSLVAPLAVYRSLGLQVQGAICFTSPEVISEVWHRVKLTGLWWEELAGGANRRTRQSFPGLSSVLNQANSRIARPCWKGKAGSPGEPLVHEMLFGINTWPGQAQGFSPRSIDLNVQFLRRTGTVVEWASKQTLSPTTVPVFVGVDLTGKAAVVLGSVTTTWTLPNFEISLAELGGVLTDNYKFQWAVAVTRDLSGWTLVEAT
jgi:hypothetical protein